MASKKRGQTVSFSHPQGPELRLDKKAAATMKSMKKTFKADKDDKKSRYSPRLGN